MSARGGLRGAGGDVGAPGPRGHKKALCSSHPTSEIMLALRKYGVTSRRNFTVERRKMGEMRKIVCIEEIIELIEFQCRPGGLCSAGGRRCG